jgi:hypothetical protein
MARRPYRHILGAFGDPTPQVALHIDLAPLLTLVAAMVQSCPQRWCRHLFALSASQPKLVIVKLMIKHPFLANPVPPIATWQSPGVLVILCVPTAKRS